jgi:P2 family phage contractile tail tube protein
MARHDQTGRAEQVPVTATLTGIFKELPSGTIKAAEKSDGTEHLMTVYYYKLEVSGKKVYEVDVFNNIFFCGETDNLEQFRLNQ